MRACIMLILGFVLLGCSKTTYTIIDAVKGSVLALETKTSESDVKIYTDKFAFNAFDTILTDRHGLFFVDGIELKLSPNYGNYEYHSVNNNISTEYYFHKEGYKIKRINLKNYEQSRNNQLDTIDLGIIYLEKNTNNQCFIYKDSRFSLDSIKHFKCLKDKQKEVYLFYTNKQKRIHFDSIVIFTFNQKKQTIHLETDESTSFTEDEIIFDINQDINFDGYNDIRVINYKGTYNVNFSFWIFDDTDLIYKHYPKLDSIINPVIDPVNKVIKSDYHIGLDKFHNETYLWKDDSLILKKSLIKAFGIDGNEYIMSKELIDGEYIQKSIIVE